MKTCTKCLQQKPLGCFYKRASGKDGLYANCIACHAQMTRKRHQELSVLNPEYAKKSISRVLTWAANNPERAVAAGISYRKENAARLKTETAIWRSKNKDKANAHTRKAQAKRAKRVPSWLTQDDIRDINLEYELAVWCSKVMGVKYHVDHIIPLSGKLVSGLHVPSNLQVIPAAVNLAKRNNF